MTQKTFVFGPFQLDQQNALLRRSGERILLAPKPFGVLVHLVERAGELVTKEELLNAVWSDVHVSESSLSVTINALRTALDDNKQSPRYIETVPRRGYRFIAAVEIAHHLADPARDSGLKPQGEAADRHRGWRVGRDAALQTLQLAMQKADEGQRQVVFITGEAGIGKTTLLQMAEEHFQADGISVLRCACNEMFGAREAFLPLIEALHEHSRRTDGAGLVKSLRTRAPTWLAQVPGLLGDDERTGFQHDIFGATRERMLLEFADLMEHLSAKRTWVIILEDLHWSDFGTVDVLSRLARRDHRAAILVLATYRPNEVETGNHPIRSVHADLQIRGRCIELPLDRLSQSETEHYLTLRFNSPALAEDLCKRIFKRTNGQPLFVVSLVDHLVGAGILVESNGHWRLEQSDAAAREAMPRDLQSMITRQIEQFGPEERSLLEAASAAGAEFSALHLAGALDRPVLEIEQRCEQLARVGGVIFASGVTEWPNGAISGQYAFQHALYQEALYRRLPPARRADTHSRLGDGLEQGYGSHTREIAAALALHFEIGRRFAKAVSYLTLAAENAARRFSPQEAAAYLTRALELVPYLAKEQRTDIQLKLLRQRAWAWRAGGDFARSIADLHAIAAAAAAGGLIQDEVNALVDLSRFFLYIDPRRCLPFAEQALERCRAIGDPAFGALVQGNAANLRMMLFGWSANDAEFCREASEVIGDSSDLNMRMRRYSMEIVVELLRADYPACRRVAEKGKALLREIGDIYVFTLYTTVEAFAMLYQGEWGGLQQTVSVALSAAERNQNLQAVALCHLTLGWLYAEVEQFERAAELADIGLTPQAEANPFSFFIGRSLLVRTHLGRGDLVAARSHLVMIEERLAVQGIPMESAIVPHHLLNVFNYWLVCGELEKASQASANLHAFVAAAPDLPFLALACDAAARLCLGRDDTATARKHLSEAIKALRRVHAPFAARRVYTTIAEVFDRAGDVQRAPAWRRRANDMVALLAHSLAPDDPLRAAPFFALTTRID
ncbi:Conserved hypothetical protein: putative Transcriptional regulatory protein [Bradyrhizobium sp. ORS 278]|uniref:ATP-binding protein n=1 Tax=Bradyrhizobium sp. (strain ORS 278) TaxID=114615 RepID=UPI000150874E|nr:AAA family ATPase [Bradyrhizobium sp. ORS 278]CAL76919.1 Conserved hypothetical protein: putative Transcriptional regulatory protein [Bradyrhizobium sp. ORS 278]